MARRQSDGGKAVIIDEHFIDALAHLWELSTLSQKDFAGRLGMSPQYLHDLLLGRRNPSVAVASAIVRYLGLRGGRVSAERYWHRIAARTHGWQL